MYLYLDQIYFFSTNIKYIEMYIEMYFSEVCVTSENAEGCYIYIWDLSQKVDFLFCILKGESVL